MTEDEKINKLLEVKDLHNNHDFIEALELCNDVLDEDPEDPRALNLMAVIFISTNKKGLAFSMASRALAKAPEYPEVWVNFGKCQTDDPEGWEKSEQCFLRAIELDVNHHMAMMNLSSLMIQQCRPEEGLEWAEKALKVNPQSEQALSCKGFACLMLGQWQEGFKNYDYTIGQSSRPIINYTDERYAGEEGEVIMVNGEQGIGDELIYSSFLRDIAKKNKVVYDCMPRLRKLMARSFADEPNIYVSGDRWQLEETILPDEFMPTKSASIASLGQYVRHSDKDFSGKSYLKADPDIQVSIRGLLDSISDKPKIGIAWTGGTKQSRMQFRQLDLERLTPVLRNQEVDFISLQYKDPSEEIEAFEKARGIKIHHFPWITEVKDYDLTAALVSELDLVIAVPTSATQLAGSLGTEAWVLVPETTGWLFYPKTYVWADSVKLFHQWTPKTVEKALKMWTNPIKKVANV